ncbi:hypothetical protein [Kingella kingae]|nr:hypothetical protein [Kingella kingae]MDK4575225.1 hypothetical protein [Kingella kingae]MDK4607346.1 hypothetical protein [Kingella kingae]MDK4625341.1 hypothetical protein [Kingella kingae]MDK4661014.1 hypothetical protein [Kingella kingae]MDK4668949.1 hypothetical protein [Kingella kingae]
MNTQEQQIAKQVLAHPKFQRMAQQKRLTIDINEKSSLHFC